MPMHLILLRRNNMKLKNLATGFAILAAALYAINVLLSKLLLEQVQPTMMAALLYLGAGIGMLLYSLIGKALGQATIKEPLTKKSCRILWPW